MTTFDDSELFDLVEEEGHDPRRRRRGTLAAFAVATLVVLAGIVWLVAARVAGDAPPAMSVALLEREAQPTDEIPDEVAAETGIDPATARFAVRSTAGRHFAALRPQGDLCLVVVPDADVARATCTAADAAATVTLTGEDGSRVLLAADGADAPADGGTWRPAGPNVWVLEPAPAEG